MSSLRGGYGLAPYGRNNFGSAESTFEPRFYTSMPKDEAHNVSVETWIRFTIYHATGHTDLDSVGVEISEDGGSSFAPALSGQSFSAPYSGRLRRRDGQTIIVYIVKDTDWPKGREIIVRYTGPNEFGQTASKEMPVVWG